jgi:hypothetical protein
MFSTSAPPSAGCAPGSGGVPDGVAGRVLCGDWLGDAGHALADRWPMLAFLAGVAVALRIGWGIWSRRRWSRHADGARWLGITPPVSATPAATVQLWRLLATVLPAPRRFALRPPRLVWEAEATPQQIRVGLWVPPGVNPIAVTRIVQRAWPGARLSGQPRPRLPLGVHTAAHRLTITQPEWLPLLDDPPPATPRNPGGTAAPGEDRLRATFDGLAAAGRTGLGILQVHISRAPRWRVAGLRRATINPHRTRHHGGRVAGLAFAGLAAVVRAVLDLATAARTTTTTSSRRQEAERDPYATQLTAGARAKYGDPPHLLATVYAAAAGPTKPAAHAAAEDISSGYGLVSAQLSRRRLHRPHRHVHSRWAPVSQMTLVSVTEAAALAGLPLEPAAYGLPAAAARARTPTRDVWTPSDDDHTDTDVSVQDGDV